MHITEPCPSVLVLMAVALVIPLTATGLTLAVVEPSPNAPSGFAPQQSTLPPRITAHVSTSPAESAIAFVMPVTATGSQVQVVGGIADRGVPQIRLQHRQ